MILETNSPQETFSAGRQLGEKAFPGQVITLTGDLGVGKTVFTQGLAKGLGIEEPVNSPTFTIVQVLSLIHILCIRDRCNCFGNER